MEGIMGSTFKMGRNKKSILMSACRFSHKFSFNDLLNLPYKKPATAIKEAEQYEDNKHTIKVDGKPLNYLR